MILDFVPKALHSTSGDLKGSRGFDFVGAGGQKDGLRKPQRVATRTTPSTNKKTRLRGLP